MFTDAAPLAINFNSFDTATLKSALTPSAIKSHGPSAHKVQLSGYKTLENLLPSPNIVDRDKSLETLSLKGFQVENIPVLLSKALLIDSSNAVTSLLI